MKADAQSLVEKKALEWAVGHFKRSRNSLKRGANKRRSNAEMECMVFMYDKWGHEDPEWQDRDLADLVTAAGKDERTFVFLREYIAELIERGKPLCGPLRDFTAKFLRNPYMKVKRCPGPDRLDWAWRDFLIERAIRHIAETWKFAATRHSRDLGKRPSAASIVQEALAKGANFHITEAAINKIWRRESLGKTPVGKYTVD
jgi:hypothetical protein